MIWVVAKSDKQFDTVPGYLTLFNYAPRPFSTIARETLSSYPVCPFIPPVCHKSFLGVIFMQLLH
jgi:hypothetical protein